MARTRFLVFVLCFTFFAASLGHANTLFEGWFEVYIGAKKVGFVVERYEFADNKFKSTYYLKTNADGSSVTESLKAFSGPDLSPQKYAYTSLTGKDIKIIDADFKGEMMTLNINDGKQKTKQTKRIKKGTFLSQFLLYLLLQQKGGIKVGSNYQYSAIAEEDGTAYNGSAFVKNLEPVKGKQAYRILNEFKKEKFLTWISTTGQPLLTRQPDNNIDVRASSGMAEATKDMMVNMKDLKDLFGKIPGSGDSGEEATEKTVAAPKAAAGPDIKLNPPPSGSPSK